MAKQDDELEDFGRFTEPALLILISLADGAKHGYAMTDDIEQVAGVRFGPGTLYGAITRLEGRGLIQRMESEDRRNPYRLTALGERALRARLASLQAVARVGQRRLASA
jgi:DNA-binding PadR family transcriptional regulator